MSITNTLKKSLSPQNIFLLGTLLTLILSLTWLSSSAHGAAESYMDSYQDNAGGSQSMRVTRASGENRPAIVFVHGGGWFSDGGTYPPEFQERAANWGYTTFRISYRLMPGGVYEQLEDVMRSIRHVKDNASKYGIDPNRVAIWGDSAGGSLTVRTAATGKSGTAAAVGWSAPTNAFRDLFNSVPGFFDGLFHTRCIGEYFPPFTMDIISFFTDNANAVNSLVSGQPPSQADSIKLLYDSLKLADIVITDLPSTFDKLEQAGNDFGVSVKFDTPKEGSSGTTPPKDTSDDAPISEKELEQKLAVLSPSDLAKVGTAIYHFYNINKDGTIDSDEALQTLSLMKQGLSDITTAQQKVAQEKAVSGEQPAIEDGADAPSDKKIVTDKPLTPNESSGELGVNPQQISAEKIAQCMDDFIQLSPSLFASPRTPPMFLAVAENEELVNAQDAYQMRDKLRSMGIRSETLVLPGNHHMGYDSRAEVPSFQFLGSILNP